MSKELQSFFTRFLQYPLPVLMVGFYMYWMSRVIAWGMTPQAGENAEWLVAAVTIPGAAFFRFYVDLLLKGKES